ncbi:2-phosphosulfolactate phosphatase [Egibacter rhizosphaerae]|uniref:Probable 2-phosphosulfolactate phosphatase n=1 Tax=Egibacter rhizosphaerae TaxID=1670831 RepID=A0A411YD37_9ACTN|nr:2-phosphosulfolactate phosphatase [Egibacter rhizosphaerae]QBI19086.1 2-phosphosulfolactate phosphatase [Egibacter rhizosphaerae]
MEIVHRTLADVDRAEGLVVVVDVLRAFTTGALALAAGAREIVCVATVEEALAERDRRPGSLAMGEVGGRPVEGLDLGNSPSELDRARDRIDLTDRTIVQRTSAGTQGVVGAGHGADALFAASFVCAGATLRAVHALAPREVTFVATGVDDRDGDEDLACAEYLAAGLSGDEPDPGPFLERVRASDAARPFLHDPDPDFPAADVAIATRLDTVDTALWADLTGEHPVLRRAD